MMQWPHDICFLKKQLHRSRRTSAYTGKKALDATGNLNYHITDLLIEIAILLLEF